MNQKLQNLMSDPDNNDARHWENNAHQIQQIYWQMGVHLKDEGRPREQVQEQQRLSHQWRLNRDKSVSEIFGESGLGKQVTISTRSCCDACHVLEGKEYTFGDALNEAPLPQAQCEWDWCLCTWARKRGDNASTSDLFGFDHLADELSLEIEHGNRPTSASQASQGCLSSVVLLVGVLLLTVVAAVVFAPV